MSTRTHIHAAGSPSESVKSFGSPSSQAGSTGPQKKRKRDLVGEIPDAALDEDQLAKRLRRRELNKQAARQSRARKQSRIEELEMKVRELNERNESLEETLKLKQREHSRLLALLKSHDISTKSFSPQTTGRVVTAMMSVAIIAVALSDRVLERAAGESLASHDHQSQTHEIPLFANAQVSSAVPKDIVVTKSEGLPLLNAHTTQVQFSPGGKIERVLKTPSTASAGLALAGPLTKPKLNYPKGWISELPSASPSQPPPTALVQDDQWPKWQDFGVPTEGVPLDGADNLLTLMPTVDQPATQEPVLQEIFPNHPPGDGEQMPHEGSDFAFLSF